MPFSGFDVGFLGQLKKSSASPVQIYLLQRIIRAIEPQALLSQHAAALAGIATEVPRAQAALLSHAEKSQPRRTLLIALINNARTTVDRVRHARVSDQILTDLFSALDAGSASVARSSGRTQLQASSKTLAQQLDPLIQQIPDQLSRNFHEAWIIRKPTSQEWKILECVSDEVACLVASSDRDSSSLEWQIPAAIRRQGLDPIAIYKALLPDPMKYHVACVIRGAGKLAKLGTLEPTAQQEQSSDPEYHINWPGRPNERLRKFIDKIFTSTDDCVISVDVDAADRASAARLGRRRVTELLDQYVAGMRLIYLTIDPITLVSRACEDDAQEWEPTRRSARQAYPLLDYWPEGLREGLRTAHVARITDAPLTTAALSWVALEACGLEYPENQKLARVLSLQALRQQIVEAHQMILQSVASSLQYWRSEVKTSAGMAKKYQVGLTRLPPDYEQRRQELESLLKSYEERHTSAKLRLTQLQTVIDETIPLLNRYAAVDIRNHLLDLNTWVDILLPDRVQDSAELASARAALSTLLPELAPLPAQQIIDWRERLGDSEICAHWLTTTQFRMAALLDALYSARNLALHSGVFTASGDAILGQGGILVVDFTFEFLGNWYRTAPNSEPPKTPAEVIEEIAARQQTILDLLAAHNGPVYPLDVGFLTGPSTIGAWG
jgi:hypothetical protein